MIAANDNVKLFHGDCLELMKSLPDASVDMILCDLPYGTTACAWDSVIPFDDLWAQYRRIAKPNAAILLNAGQPFTTALIQSNMRHFKYCWVWKKPQGVDPFMAKHRPMNNVEDIVVFSYGKPLYLPQMVEGKPYKVVRDKSPRVNEVTGALMTESVTENSGNRLPTRVLEFKQQRGLHPTQKPVALMEYLVRTYTNEGDVVLDNCMGSGTTGVACINTDRRFIGMEMDASYFAIAQSRILAAQPVADNDNQPNVTAVA
jgi:site-specific DNA-methyltransferase (adenine-specific)